jgi:hypothetical protein
MQFFHIECGSRNVSLINIERLAAALSLTMSALFAKRSSGPEPSSKGLRGEQENGGKDPAFA